MVEYLTIEEVGQNKQLTLETLRIYLSAQIVKIQDSIEDIDNCLKNVDEQEAERIIRKHYKK